MMMILFTHLFTHHHNQVMTYQMMTCIHHQMNNLICHNIHHHHRTPFPGAHWHSCCSRYRYCAQYDYTATFHFSSFSHWLSFHCPFHFLFTTLVATRRCRCLAVWRFSFVLLCFVLCWLFRFGFGVWPFVFWW